MRILVVPKWYPWPDQPVFGIFCREQARALARRHDVVVLPSRAVRRPDFVAWRLDDAVENGLRTLRLRYRRPMFRPGAMACQIAGMLAGLMKLQRDGWRPDAVHAHVYSAGLPALILGRASRSPVVITEHYTGFQRGKVTGYDHLTARIAFRYANLVAPVSDNLAQSVRAVEPRARVRVVANVVNTDVFHPPAEGRARTNDGPAQLLTVASLVAKKGHADLLEAVAELRTHRECDARLDLVGDGEAREALEQRVRELELEQIVRFHGEQPNDRVAEMMRRADLFVLPSLFENLPCALIEATASGLPSVATNVGGAADILGDHGGALCPPSNPRALADAISSVLERRGEFDPSAIADRARRLFGYSAFADVWTQIYERLLSSAGTTS